MSGEDRIELRITVHELEAIERALRAARALEIVAAGKPAVDDALQAVEVVLTSATDGATKPRETSRTARVSDGFNNPHAS
jgi:hypothetical protein